MTILTRLYVPYPLHIHHRLWLEGQPAHRLLQVLRAKVGDLLTLFNGEGGEFRARVQTCARKKVELEIIEFMARECESPIAIQLAQGISKGEKMDLIIQKAVELGVASLTPLITERCNVRIGSERQSARLQHWRAVAISACEQSGRNRIPQIHAPVPFPQWLPKAHAACCLMMVPQQAPTAAGLPTSAAGLCCSPAPASFLLLVGPEGGLTADESELAHQHGFLPFNLGPRVLRTETAALAGIVVLQSHFGDFNFA